MSIVEAGKPWISAVQGAAAGIGSAYAMSCDLTVMAEDAYIYQAFASIGLVPDGGATWHLTRLLGRKRAYELIATGERVPAQRCLEWGLCNRVVPRERLQDEVFEWAEALAGRAPLSLRYAKEAIRTAAESDLDVQVLATFVLIVNRASRGEFDEGFGAPGVGTIIERLAPRIIGKPVGAHERIGRVTGFALTPRLAR